MLKLEKSHEKSFDSNDVNKSGSNKKYKGLPENLINEMINYENSFDDVEK